MTSARLLLVLFVGTVVGAVTGLVVGGLSLALFDAHLWPEFFEKMRHHGNTFFMWHVGFKKWAVTTPELMNPKNYAQPGVGQVEALQIHLNAAYDARRWLFDPIRLALAGTAVAVSWRRPAAQATLIVGSVLLFVSSMPANYYYVYLALFPAVLWTNRADWNAAFRMLLVFGMLIAISVSTWMGAGWPVQNGWINGSILTFFVLLLASLAVDRGLGTDRADLPGVSTG